MHCCAKQPVSDVLVQRELAQRLVNIVLRVCVTSGNGAVTPASQVSKAAADLMAYCDAHIREDPLIVPVPASENPFREKKFFCTIL
ncbi:hypothetical protein F2P81_020034 [Scophthalmus maximus]|uniref:Guanine nucleotide-binding protein subunit gamma n=1 Tax=Scophthalmus maximus TaxID=52904 RepID=A0A6A4RZ13_SCOMX|nr:hypothetical protein F2P81_020034 [Scophthalmus maximus]